MPEIEHAMAFTDETRTKHNIGPIIENRLNEPRILGRIVFQVGILYENHIASRMFETFTESGALALIERLIENADVVIAELLEHRAGAIGGKVINDDDFLGNRHRLDTVDEPGD